MSAYRFSVSIMPRTGILDPAGKAVEAALPQLDALAKEMLANPLIESWTIEAP